MKDQVMTSNSVQESSKLKLSSVIFGSSKLFLRFLKPCTSAEPNILKRFGGLQNIKAVFRGLWNIGGGASINKVFRAPKTAFRTLFLQISIFCRRSSKKFPKDLQSTANQCPIDTQTTPDRRPMDSQIDLQSTSSWRPIPITPQ